MYCLSDKQIDFILDDISARGVGMASLQQSLLDHICCVIEQNLDEDGDFEGFYTKTISRFYKTELKEIEDETINLLIHKNYYIMKKVMLVSGTLSAIILCQGILFKFMHWPGAAALIFLGVVLLSFVFLPLLFTLKIKEKKNTRDKIIIGVATCASIMISIGILFKIMHWPGANVILIAALGFMVLLFLPLYFFTGIRNPETKVNTIVSSILIVAGSALLLTLVRSPARTKNDFAAYGSTFRGSEQLLKNEQKLTAMLLLKNGAAPALDKTAEEVINLCESIKSFLLEKEALNNGGDSKSEDILITDGFVRDYFSPEEKAKLNELKQKIESYNKALRNAAQQQIQTELTILDKSTDKRILEALNDLIHIEMAVLQNHNLEMLLQQ